jgi:hypothetical protein
MNAVEQSLIKSLIGRGIVIAFLTVGIVECWNGADDFSRSFSKALGVLLLLSVFDALFGAFVFTAFRRSGVTAAISGGSIFATRFSHWCFVVFLPGSSDSVLVSIYDESGMQHRSEQLSLSRKLFCGPDALGRTRAVRLPSTASVVRLEILPKANHTGSRLDIGQY